MEVRKWYRKRTRAMRKMKELAEQGYMAEVERGASGWHVKASKRN